MRAFCCWSGGKESALSLYKARGQGMDVKCLLNMISEDGKHSRSHGISSNILKRQAECMDIALIQPKSTWEDYEKEFKKSVSSLDSIEGGVFGDIDMQEHRDWVERVCRDLGIVPVLPLWDKEREALLQEFIKVGFEAIVVATNAGFMGEDWLGRMVDREFIRDLKAIGNVDLCGERGEYHTFVFNGPIFKKAVEIKYGGKTLRDNHWMLEIV